MDRKHFLLTYFMIYFNPYCLIKLRSRNGMGTFTDGSIWMRETNMKLVVALLLGTIWHR